MIKPTFSLTPSAFKDSVLYSERPSDGSGDFIHTRGSVATRVNKDGFIEEVGIDVPRIDHLNNGCPELLLEPASTNLILQSESIDTTRWGKTGMTATDNSGISPLGTKTASLLADSSGGFSVRFFSQSVSKSASSNTYTFSIFAKAREYSSLDIRLDDGGANYVRASFNTKTGIYISNVVGGTGFSFGDAGVVDYGRGWFRCYITATTNTGTTIRPVIYINGASGYDPSEGYGQYIFGAQLEEAPVSRSYIKTIASTVTRSADFCVDSMLNDSRIASDKFTFFVNFKKLPVGHGNNKRISINDNSVNNKIQFNCNYDVETISIGFIIAGSSSEGFFSASGLDEVKIAITTTSDGFKAYINGVLVFTNSSTIFTAGELLTSLDFTQAGNSLPFEGRIKGLKYWNSELTEEEMVELTTL